MLSLQAKLTEGLSLAKEFHSNIQELLNKMSKCEESIGLLPAPSFVLDTVCTQLQEHRVGFPFFLSATVLYSKSLLLIDKIIFLFITDTGE